MLWRLSLSHSKFNHFPLSFFLSPSFTPLFLLVLIEPSCNYIFCVISLASPLGSCQLMEAKKGITQNALHLVAASNGRTSDVCFRRYNVEQFAWDSHDLSWKEHLCVYVCVRVFVQVCVCISAHSCVCIVVIHLEPFRACQMCHVQISVSSFQCRISVNEAVLHSPSTLRGFS